MRKTAVTCPCGAVYEREEHKTIDRGSDSYARQECGHKLESWTDVLQLRPHPSEVVGDAGYGGRVSDKLWEIGDIAKLIEDAEGW